MKAQTPVVPQCVRRVSIAASTYVSPSPATSSSSHRAPRSDSTLRHHGQQHSLTCKACSLGFSPTSMCRDTKSRNSARETGKPKKHRTLTNLRRNVHATYMPSHLCSLQNTRQARRLPAGQRSPGMPEIVSARALYMSVPTKQNGCCDQGSLYQRQWDFSKSAKSISTQTRTFCLP